MTSGEVRPGRSGLYISGHNSRVNHPMQGKHHTDEAKAALASYTGEQASSYRHGQSRTITYTSWHAMLGRCYDRRNASFPQYGRKGIIVCERWHDFESFLGDMGPRPSLDYSLDRYPDGKGNYEPGNCRWATKPEQRANQEDRTTPNSPEAYAHGWAKRRENYGPNGRH